MPSESAEEVAESLATETPADSAEVAAPVEEVEQSVPLTTEPAAEATESWADLSEVIDSSAPSAIGEIKEEDVDTTQQVLNILNLPEGVADDSVATEGTTAETTVPGPTPFLEPEVGEDVHPTEAFDDIDQAKSEQAAPSSPSEQVETTDLLGLEEETAVGAETSVEASVPAASEPEVADSVATDPTDIAAPPTSPNLVPPGVEPIQTGHTPASGSRPPRVRSSRGGQTTRWQEANRSWYQDFDRVRWWLYENSGGRRHGGFWLRKYSLQEADRDQRWFTSLFGGISDFLDRLDCLILCYYIWPTYQTWVTRFGLDRALGLEHGRQAVEDEDIPPKRIINRAVLGEEQPADSTWDRYYRYQGVNQQPLPKATGRPAVQPDAAQPAFVEPTAKASAPAAVPEPTSGSAASGSAQKRSIVVEDHLTPSSPLLVGSRHSVKLTILLHPLGQNNPRKAHHLSLLQGSLSPDATQLVVPRVQEPPPDPEDPNEPEEEEGEWVEEEEEEEPAEEDQVLEEEAELRSPQEEPEFPDFSSPRARRHKRPHSLPPVPVRLLTRQQRDDLEIQQQISQAAREIRARPATGLSRRGIVLQPAVPGYPETRIDSTGTWARIAGPPVAFAPQPGHRPFAIPAGDDYYINDIYSVPDTYWHNPQLHRRTAVTLTDNLGPADVVNVAVNDADTESEGEESPARARARFDEAGHRLLEQARQAPIEADPLPPWRPRRPEAPPPKRDCSCKTDRSSSNTIGSGFKEVRTGTAGAATQARQTSPEVAAAMRDAATSAILHNQEEAEAALAERDRGAGASRRTPLVLTQCRVCGELHDELDCPHLTMNQPDAPQPPIDYAEQEEDTIRVKSLPDMVFPNPPDNAGQARGYINQVLMAIGKLQKTPGNEVYQWAQECLVSDESILQADPRFTKLVEEEKEAERAKKTPAAELLSETEVGDADDEAHAFIFRGEEISEPMPSHLSPEEEALYDAICGD
eukprot:s5920_g1.t1